LMTIVQFVLFVFAQAPELPTLAKPAVARTKSLGKLAGDAKNEELTGENCSNTPAQDDLVETMPAESSHAPKESNSGPMSPVAAERREGNDQEPDFNTSLTGMSNTGVAFAADAAGERCAIEGNICMGLAQSALKDEVLERLGGTKEILSGLVLVLNTGTEWAAGSAARAIANIAYRAENLKKFVALLDDAHRDKLISGLALLTTDQMRPKSKEYATLCIANMLAHDVLLMSFKKSKASRKTLRSCKKNQTPRFPQRLLVLSRS